MLPSDVAQHGQSRIKLRTQRRYNDVQETYESVVIGGGLRALDCPVQSGERAKGILKFAGRGFDICRNRARFLDSLLESAAKLRRGSISEILVLPDRLLTVSFGQSGDEMRSSGFLQSLKAHFGAERKCGVDRSLLHKGSPFCCREGAH